MYHFPKEFAWFETTGNTDRDCVIFKIRMEAYFSSVVQMKTFFKEVLKNYQNLTIVSKK